MQYFIGIVPSDEYKEKIFKVQQRLENNLLVDVVEPHITVKAQGGLTADLEWIEKLKKICANFPVFNISLNQPMFFGESVLFLSVTSEKIFELHQKIVKAISPDSELIKKYMELDNYVPHLTMGQTAFGLSSKDLKVMAKIIEKELSPYPTFEVSFIRIYQEKETNKYVKYLDIPLKRHSQM
ncbi:2'-5' RNA ligase family protein [Bacillus cytotoxicus]|uniref:2'-5' RNA ligase family protein n=1 Tax=Bacillus cytotoxicus TaxID=580165 RepID=A0ACC6A848_9BACI|nr:2'-5' RNA ligase family protein [Bacillus cytotoxicus]